LRKARASKAAGAGSAGRVEDMAGAPATVGRPYSMV
jgi:hypothetical protein